MPGRFILLQRGSDMRTYPNHSCRISGYLDDDRSVEDKARREMLEEVGIIADRIVSMRRGTVLLQEAPEIGKSWFVVPVLVHVRDRRYRLDWESSAAGWFSITEAMSLPLLRDSTTSSLNTAKSSTDLIACFRVAGSDSVAPARGR